MQWGRTFYIKIKLLDFKISVQLAKLHTVGSRLVSNGLTFSDDIPSDI